MRSEGEWGERKGKGEEIARTPWMFTKVKSWLVLEFVRRALSAVVAVMRGILSKGKTVAWGGSKREGEIVVRTM